MSGSLPDTGTTLQIVHWKIADEIPHPRIRITPTRIRRKQTL